MIVHAPAATRLDVAGAATACLTLFSYPSGSYWGWSRKFLIP
jgi:hypothetical protein